MEANERLLLKTRWRILSILPGMLYPDPVPDSCRMTLVRVNKLLSWFLTDPYRDIRTSHPTTPAIDFFPILDQSMSHPYGLS
jgi:hypothetical protein